MQATERCSVKRKTVIELGHAEALVLFEFLCRLDDSEDWPTDPAEQLALWRLAGALEKTLAEPLMADYQQLLGDARSALRKQAGAGTDESDRDGCGQG